MKYSKQEMLQAVDQSIEALGNAEILIMHPETARLLFGEETTYSGLIIITDELCDIEKFYVNSGLEEL